MNSQVLEELYSMRSRNKFCDALLVGSDEVEVPAHSCILAAASKPLQEVMEDQVQYGDQVVIPLPFLDSSAIENLLHFLYLGRFIKDKVNLTELKLAAEKMCITCLMNMYDELQQKHGESGVVDPSTKTSINQAPEVRVDPDLPSTGGEDDDTADAIYENFVVSDVSEPVISKLADSTVSVKQEGLETRQLQSNAVEVAVKPDTGADELDQDSVSDMFNVSDVKGQDDETSQGLKPQPDFENIEFNDENSLLEVVETPFPENSSAGSLSNRPDASDSADSRSGKQTKPQAISLLKNSSLVQADRSPKLLHPVQFNEATFGIENEEMEISTQPSQEFDLEQMNDSETASNAFNLVPVEESEIMTNVVQDEEMTAHVQVEALVRQTDGSMIKIEVSVPSYSLSEDGIPRETLEDILQRSSVDGVIEETKILYIYKCNQCQVRFDDLEHYTSHMLSHDATRQHFCPICGTGFKYKHNMKLHMKRHGHRNVACNFCSKTFYSKHDLDLHLRSHTGERPFVCNFCNKTFSQSSNMLSHKRSVHNDVYLNGARDYTCTYCSKAFKTRDMMNKHMKRHMAKLTCQRCDNCFRTRTELQKHMLDAHDIKELHPAREDGSLELYQCFLCQRSFLSKKKVDMHMKLVHEKNRRYRCPLPHCDYEAYYKCHIDRHIKIHESRKKYQVMSGAPLQMYPCLQCGAEFNTKKFLMTHHCTGAEKSSVNPSSLMAVKEEVVEEETSGDLSIDTRPAVRKPAILAKKSLTGSQLADELARQVTETVLPEGTTQYQCNLCKAVVYTLKGIEKHLAVHDRNRKIHVCDLCDKGFFQRAHLQRHLAINHDKQRRFLCLEEGCSYMGYYMSQMDHHYRLKHKDTDCPPEHRLRILDPEQEEIV